MRVALSVDAVEPLLSGIGRYTLQLSRGLKTQGDVEELNFFRGYELVDDPEALLCVGEGSVARLVRPPRIVRWWKKKRHGAKLRNLDTGVVHSTNFFLPDWASGGVATIHDLSVLRFPHTHPEARLKDFADRFDRTIARASHFITSTEAVRSELITQLSIPAQKITAIPIGIDRPSVPVLARLDASLEKLGLRTGSYSLCVATIEPRKRIGELIDAYTRLPLAILRNHPLVLVGKEGWLAGEIKVIIDRAQSAGWLKWLGFTTDEQLDDLYFGARLFIYPSLYEGYGLPPLEAMARGVPTLISDDPSLVEVSGKAAMIIDADDPLTFARSIEQGLFDTSWRQEAIQRGRQLVESLDADRTVRETLDVYRRLNT